MNSEKPENKGVFDYIKSSMLAFIGISIILYLVAWRIFGFDPLKAGGKIEEVYQKSPIGFTFISLAYFVYAALRHGRAYKRERLESDLVWAGLLWILAVISMLIIMLDLIF